jgi:hypothetical protein
LGPELPSLLNWPEINPKDKTPNFKVFGDIVRRLVRLPTVWRLGHAQLSQAAHDIVTVAQALHHKRGFIRRTATRRVQKFLVFQPISNFVKSLKALMAWEDPISTVALLVSLPSAHLAYARVQALLLMRVHLDLTNGTWCGAGGVDNLLRVLLPLDGGDPLVLAGDLVL